MLVVRSLQLSLATHMALPVLAVSADEVVWALVRAGFYIVERPVSVVVLERGLRTVTVPAAAVLSREALLVLLRDAGIPYTHFVELLAEPCKEPEARSRVRLRGRGQR
jgi:hypothetical protein